jgi:hypothetical protein
LATSDADNTADKSLAAHRAESGDISKGADQPCFSSVLDGSSDLRESQSSHQSSVSEEDKIQGGWHQDTPVAL